MHPRPLSSPTDLTNNTYSGALTSTLTLLIRRLSVAIALICSIMYLGGRARRPKKRERQRWHQNLRKEEKTNKNKSLSQTRGENGETLGYPIPPRSPVRQRKKQKRGTPKIPTRFCTACTSGVQFCRNALLLDASLSQEYLTVPSAYGL